VVITIDREGIILFINRVVPGFTIEQTIGTHSTQYLPPEMHDEFRERLRRVFEEGQAQSYETEGQGAYRQPAWYSSRLGPVFRDGQVVAAILIATDITPRKRAEEELRAEQQLLRELLRQQELDRQLVAYEIHDGLVQYITGALMRLDALGARREKTLAEVEHEMTSALELLRTSIREARRLISGLRPPILDESGIASAIRYLIGEHSGAKAPQISLQTQLDAARFPPALESALFRICQEALTNAVKHSRAPQVRVALGLTNGQIQLSVTDDGVGFDPKVPSKQTFGLQGIRERARLMGGKATIESRPGEGAKVCVELPLESGLTG
jgi:PAS domain S-box-containing protein